MLPAPTLFECHTVPPCQTSRLSLLTSAKARRSLAWTTMSFCDEQLILTTKTCPQNASNLTPHMPEVLLIDSHLIEPSDNPVNHRAFCVSQLGGYPVILLMAEIWLNQLRLVVYPCIYRIFQGLIRGAPPKVNCVCLVCLLGSSHTEPQQVAINGCLGLHHWSMVVSTCFHSLRKNTIRNNFPTNDGAPPVRPGVWIGVNGSLKKLFASGSSPSV